MDLNTLKLPAKGFTKAEREWIRSVLIPAITTVQGIQGRNCTIDNSESGQTINADDCPPAA